MDFLGQVNRAARAAASLCRERWTALLSASEYQIGPRAPGQREPPLARQHLAGRLLPGQRRRPTIAVRRWGSP